jgi:proteasome lid subunit RPN8/RPN11
MTIVRAALDEIVRHAREEAPLECCGLLIGGGDRIQRTCRAANLEESTVRFTVDPADHFDAIREARREGLSVVGAYHSHPRSPAVPSPTDVERANDDGFVHVIVSLATDDPNVRAYVIAGGAAAPVELTPVDGDD